MKKSPTLFTRLSIGFISLCLSGLAFAEAVLTPVFADFSIIGNVLSTHGAIVVAIAIGANIFMKVVEILIRKLSKRKKPTS